MIPTAFHGFAICVYFTVFLEGRYHGRREDEREVEVEDEECDLCRARDQKSNAFLPVNIQQNSFDQFPISIDSHRRPVRVNHDIHLALDEVTIVIGVTLIHKKCRIPIRPSLLHSYSTQRKTTQTLSDLTDGVLDISLSSHRYFPRLSLNK